MPEGHTLHRLARDHTSWFAGGPVAVSSPQGRFLGARDVDGQRFAAAEAYGKHLFHHYDGGRIVHVHLGLFGAFQHHATPAPEPRGTVRMRITNGAHVVDLAGATICELIDPGGHEDILDRLGPDPLRSDADPERGWQALQRRSVGIGRALMDQGVVAGVGNVFRAEILFVHGLHPELPARELTRDQWESIWRTLVAWMRYGVRHGRIVTVDPTEAGKPRHRLSPEERTYVYRSPTCPRCGSPIRRWDLAGRWAYACETCQPRPEAS